MPKAKKTQQLNSVDQDWRKRLALTIASELPGNTEDALKVLDHVRNLVTGFLRPEPG